MKRQRGELVPIGDALADLDGPVKAIREASPQAAVPGSRGRGHDLRVTFRREFLCLWPACLLPSNRRSFVPYRYFLTAPRSAVAPAL